MALWIDEYYSVSKDTAKEDRILRGVVAYVEVWSGNENRCECVKTQLKSLGAIVEEKFSAKVTLVVFNEGSLTTYKKAKKKKIPLVSVLWIEESKRLLEKACVKKFCALHLDRYEEPDIFSSQKRFKRPRHVNEISSKRKGRQRKKQKLDDNKEDDPYETYFNPQLFNENAVLVKDGIISTLERVTGKTFSETEEEDSLLCSQFTAEINKPLTKKLYYRFLGETKEVEESNEVEKLPLRQSCPPVLDTENGERSKELVPEVVGNVSVEILSVVEKNEKEKQDTKVLQVPITFFFQPSVVSDRIPSIVFTGLQFDEVDMLTSVTHSIGGFQVDRAVTPRCTHVVSGYPPKRTLNILRGVARGCWILSKEWVIKSLEGSKWLNEEEFELDYFLPAIKKSRISRQNGPPFHHRSLFSSCGPIYLDNRCSPPASDLKELIFLCGGHVVSCVRAARVVVVGQGKNHISVSQRLSKPPTLVTEKWVLDSISEDSLRPFVHPYVVHMCTTRKSTA